jgi:hypothetical protein
MRILGIVALCAALSGCAATPPPAPVATFNPSEAAFARAKGAATIKGQAFLRRNDGIVVYGAGSEVLLVPRVPNSEEAVQKGFGAGKLRMEVRLFGANVMGNDFKFDPGLEPFIRRTKADGQGNFVFEAIPPGQYYVLTRVVWCIPTQYTCQQQGGDLMEVASVAPTDKAMSIMLNGT